MSLKSELRDLRKQVERLQVEVSGRQSIGAMVVWEGQNENYVSIPDDFNGLVVHLTPEPSPPSGTAREIKEGGLSQTDFIALKQRLKDELSK